MPAPTSLTRAGSALPHPLLQLLDTWHAEGAQLMLGNSTIWSASGGMIYLSAGKVGILGRSLTISQELFENRKKTSENH